MSRQTRYGVVLLLLLAAVLRLWWWHVGPKVIENEGTTTPVSERTSRRGAG